MLVNRMGAWPECVLSLELVWVGATSLSQVASLQG